MRAILILVAMAALTWQGGRRVDYGPIRVARGERQLTHGPLQKDLDDNVNFSPDGRWLVVDCRDARGIGPNRQLARVDVRTGETTVIYSVPKGVEGVGAASYMPNGEILAIHGIPGLPYDFTLRGGMIIPPNGITRWLDSRNTTAPFIPGALRGGTHKHEPDRTGEWIGFTYNDAVMKARGSDLRNVGVSRRGHPARVPPNAKAGSFSGESFSVLLTAAVDHPTAGSDEYSRADGDCWVYGRHLARAFRGLVVAGGDTHRPIVCSDVFIVSVPPDITKPGPLGPLEGTTNDYPKPPAGAVVRRLTRTAENPDMELRGVTGHLRASGDGRWIAFVAKTRRHGKIEPQLFVVSPSDGRMRQLSRLPGGVAGDPRFSPDSHYVAIGAPDGSVYTVSATESHWGMYVRVASSSSRPALNLVISPDSRTVAWNRDIGGVLQVFTSLLAND